MKGILRFLAIVVLCSGGLGAILTLTSMPSGLPQKTADYLEAIGQGQSQAAKDAMTNAQTAMVVLAGEIFLGGCVVAAHLAALARILQELEIANQPSNTNSTQSN